MLGEPPEVTVVEALIAYMDNIHHGYVAENASLQAQEIAIRVAGKTQSLSLNVSGFNAIYNALLKITDDNSQRDDNGESV